MDWFRGIIWGRGENKPFRYIVIGIYVTDDELKIPCQSQTLINGQTYGLFKQALENTKGLASTHPFGDATNALHQLDRNDLFEKEEDD